MTDQSVTPAAIRMRRTRERRRVGTVCFRLQLDASGIETLVAAGWLAPRDRAAQTAVTEAFLRMANKALALRITAGDKRH